MVDMYVPHQTKDLSYCEAIFGFKIDKKSLGIKPYMFKIKHNRLYIGLLKIELHSGREINITTTF